MNRRGSAVRRSATGTIRRTGTTTWASAWPAAPQTKWILCQTEPAAFQCRIARPKHALGRPVLVATVEHSERLLLIIIFLGPGDREASAKTLLANRMQAEGRGGVDGIKPRPPDINARPVPAEVAPTDSRNGYRPEESQIPSFSRSTTPKS